MYPIPMGVSPSPSAVTERLSLSPTRSNLFVYYGVLVVGAATIVLALYNLIIVRWCSYFSDPPSRQRAAGSGFNPLNKVSFGLSFKFKRDDGAGEDSECVVCLSVFEEGEELRQLPKCNHSFHSPCIDMWLYSHMDCPLCRCAVELPGVKRQPETVEQRLEHSLIYF